MKITIIIVGNQIRNEVFSVKNFLPLVIAKKFGIFIVFYFLLSAIDSLVELIYPNPYFTFGVTMIALCIMAFALKKAYVFKLNYTQEQRDDYNSSFKKKFLTIVKSYQFISEMIVIAFATILFMLIPRIAVGISYFFLILYDARAMMLLFAVIYIIFDFAIWYLAYKSCFKPKKVIY